MPTLELTIHVPGISNETMAFILLPYNYIYKIITQKHEK